MLISASVETLRLTLRTGLTVSTRGTRALATYLRIFQRQLLAFMFGLVIFCPSDE